MTALGVPIVEDNTVPPGTYEPDYPEDNHDD
jgi:hypothetical protein